MILNLKNLVSYVNNRFNLSSLYKGIGTTKSRLFIKSNFSLFVLLIITTVTGIVVIQGYWIYSTWQDREQEFSLAVTQSLQMVSQKIQYRELADYISNYNRLIDSLSEKGQSEYTDIYFFVDEDSPDNFVSYYSYGLLYEEYDLVPFIDPELGSIGSTVTDYKSKSTALVINKSDIFDRENRYLSNIERINNVQQISDQFRESTFLEYAKTRPLHKRLTTAELDMVLAEEFFSKNINTPYEFGIYDNGLATKIRSNQYNERPVGPNYAYPIFFDENRNAQYQLVVYFPKKNQYVFSSIVGISILSLILSILIISLSSMVLIQLIRQKKISQMKTDFMNNITHEFKTPIATINLAIDLLGSAVFRNDPKQLKTYLGIIREENSRMLTHVDSVLRISQMEKKSKVDMKLVHFHSVLKEAVSGLSLIIKDKSGRIQTNYDATNDNIYGNEVMLQNLVTNIIDNSTKYTKGNEPPDICIKTWNRNNQFFLSISDKGIGMSSATKKNIFEKFYRKDTGNIHNVKGYGLGLSYVKQIGDLHKAKITIDTKLKEGCTFTLTFSNDLSE